MQYPTGRVQYRASVYSQCKTTDQETDVGAHKISSELSILLFVVVFFPLYPLCHVQSGDGQSDY